MVNDDDDDDDIVDYDDDDDDDDNGIASYRLQSAAVQTNRLDLIYI